MRFRSTWARIVAGGAAAIGLVAPSPAGAAAAPPRDITAFGCPSGLSNPFSDVTGTTHEVAIECLFDTGVVSGTSPTTYTPSAAVTRGQLASFIARGLAGVGIPLDTADAGFTDLGDSVHTSAINALANLGIISGTTAATFAPDQRATRAQTASILARTVTPDLPTDPPDAFTDDEGATAHEASINGLAAVGVIGGVTPTTYVPDGDLSRGAVASFLARLYDFAVERGIATPTTLSPPIAAQLTGGAEVPGPGDGDAGGAVTLQRSPTVPGLLCVVWDIDSPFSSAPTAAHIHAGGADVAGPVVITLPTPQAPAGERSFERACASGIDIAALDNVFTDPELFYVNIHSAAFPDGASRGQLRAFVAGHHTLLTGDEEVPGPGEDGATGASFIDVYGDDTVCSFVEYTGAATPMAAHVHEAAAGASGPIVVTLPPFDADIPVSDGCVGGLDADLVADILANPDDYYVNVHTADFPDGAVRGQLEGVTFLEATLEGAEEVPGPGDFNGEGEAFVDVLGDGVICVQLRTRLIDEPAAAHIHAGVDGVAGPVVVALPTPTFGSSGGCVDVEPAVADAIAAGPEAFYVNVHNAAFPDGAIRGQLGPSE